MDCVRLCHNAQPKDPRLADSEHFYYFTTKGHNKLQINNLIKNM